MSIALTPEELQALTGYARPADQLKRLHVLGFSLAWRNLKSGGVVLPRAHYESVCRGERQAQIPAQAARPQLMPGKWQHGRRAGA